MNVILTYVRGIGVPKFNDENMTELKEKTLQKGGLLTYFITDIIKSPLHEQTLLCSLLF